MPTYSVLPAWNPPASIRTLHCGNGEGRKFGEIVLNDDGLMIRKTARRFAAERVAPFAAEWDRSGQLPAVLLNEMGRRGLFGLRIPPAYGGSGSSFRTWCVALEEIAAACAGLSTLMHVHALGTAGPIARLASETQKRRWLPSMVRGEVIGCIGLTEPHAGSDQIGRAHV